MLTTKTLTSILFPSIMYLTLSAKSQLEFYNSVQQLLSTTNEAQYNLDFYLQFRDAVYRDIRSSANSNSNCGFL